MPYRFDALTLVTLIAAELTIEVFRLPTAASPVTLSEDEFTTPVKTVLPVTNTLPVTLAVPATVRVASGVELLIPTFPAVATMRVELTTRPFLTTKSLSAIERSLSRWAMSYWSIYTIAELSAKLHCPEIQFVLEYQAMLVYNLCILVSFPQVKIPILYHS